MFWRLTLIRLSYSRLPPEIFDIILKEKSGTQRARNVSSGTLTDRKLSQQTSEITMSAVILKKRYPTLTKIIGDDQSSRRRQHRVQFGPPASQIQAKKIIKSWPHFYQKVLTCQMLHNELPSSQSTTWIRNLWFHGMDKAPSGTSFVSGIRLFMANSVIPIQLKRPAIGSEICYCLTWSAELELGPGLLVGIEVRSVSFLLKYSTVS